MKYIGRSTPVQTIGRRFKDKKNLEDNFGKGNPQKQILMKDYPKFSFTKTQRFSTKNEKQNLQIVKKQKKREFLSQRKVEKGMKFQQSQRQDSQKDKKDLPGPACYDKKSVLFKTSASISIGYKHDQQSFIYQKDNFAGPCDYKPKFDFWKKGAKFNKAKTKLNEIEPQNRECVLIQKFENLKKPQINQTFGKSIKKVNEKLQKNDLPGPGQYKINYSSKKPCQNQNLAKENTPSNNIQIKKQNDNTPGPGQYHLQNKYTDFYKKGVKFQLQKRFKSLQMENQNCNDTKLTNAIKIKYDKGIIIYKQKYQYHKNSNTPGPGQYNTQIQKRQRQSFTFARQNKQKKNKYEQNIGPGSYDAKIQNRRNSIGVIFNKAKYQKSLQIDKRQYYNLRRKFELNKMTFGKQKRFKEESLNDVGPATYNIQSTVPNNQPWLEKDKNKLIIT